MLILRFESTTGINNDEYNKLIIFDSCNKTLKAINFDLESIDKNISKKELENKFNIELNDEYKLIFNDVIKNSYSFPFKLYLDITDKCQLNCKHCLTKKLNLNNELSCEQIESIILECKEKGAFYVKLGGGEPLLHPNIFDIIKKFSDIGMLVSMSTNGILINENVAKFLKKYNVKTSVSLEGPKKINDYIRGNGHYDKALKALNVLKASNCNCLLRVTLTRHMLDENNMLQMIDLAKKMNVKLKISYCRPAGSAIDNDLLIRYEDKDKYLNIIKLLNSEEYIDLIILDEGMQINQEPSLKDILYNDRICGAANRSFHINTSGVISPCVFLGEKYYEKNSKYEEGDILNYWNGTKGTKFIEIRDVKMPLVCSNCDRLCKYECLATRLHFNDCFEINDPNCIGGMKKCLERK